MTVVAVVAVVPRCPYCGYPTSARACPEHRDLPKLDPFLSPKRNDKVVQSCPA